MIGLTIPQTILNQTPSNDARTTNIQKVPDLANDQPSERPDRRWLRLDVSQFRVLIAATPVFYRRVGNAHP